MEDKYRPKQPDQLLTLEDVAWRLSLDNTSARRLLKQGDFPKPMMIGNHPRWQHCDIDAYVSKKREAMILQSICGFNPSKLNPSPDPTPTGVPEGLLSVQNSLQEYHGFAHAHCVYFLLNQGVVVYVGKTQQLGTRTGQHIKGSKSTPKKDFDRVLYMLVDPEKVDAAEAYYIKALNPVYNLAGVEKED